MPLADMMTDIMWCDPCHRTAHMTKPYAPVRNKCEIAKIKCYSSKSNENMPILGTKRCIYMFKDAMKYNFLFYALHFPRMRNDLMQTIE